MYTHLPREFSHKLGPKFANRWISRIGSLRFWWNSVQRKALMYTICSREIFTKKCRQRQNFYSDPKEAWHYNHVTFSLIANNFMLYCRLIYMLSILYVGLTIKVKVGIPESFKVGWYPNKITGSSHLKSVQSSTCWQNEAGSRVRFSPRAWKFPLSRTSIVSPPSKLKMFTERVCMLLTSVSLKLIKIKIKLIYATTSSWEKD